MFSVLRSPPPAYDKLVTPFYCFYLPNTNNGLKCSSQPQLGYNPWQRKCFRSYCKREEQATHEAHFPQGFSALQQEDSPWGSGDVWSNLALYLFTLHIPLSFGGFSLVALLTGQSVLDPQTQALSLLTIQILEFSAALILLKYTAKPQYKFSNFFKNNNRNWFLSSALGFGFLVLLIFLTSLVAEKLFGSQHVNNPILKEILQSSDLSRVSCVLGYCIVTPLLEEVVYRGFLLTSLSSTMKWQQAVITSSIIFSAIHFSGNGTWTYAYPAINVNGSDQLHVSLDALDPTSLKALLSLLLAPCKLNLSPPLSHLKLYQGFFVSLPLTVLVVVAMGGFENRVKIRAIEVKLFFKKGVKVVSSSCKKGWRKIKHIKH